MNESEYNVQHIKYQPSFPFRDFETDELQYMYLELYWVYLFKSVIGENVDRAWTAFHPPSLERDGNPIFSVVNRSLGRAVRVIHQQMGEGDVAYREGGRYYPLYAFLSNLEDRGDEAGAPIVELGLVADLSDEGEAAARRFIAMFCVDRVTPAEMERAIVEHEASLGMQPSSEG